MEDPATKRARVLGAGPRRKRETPAEAAQQRAYKKADRKPRLEPEVKEIQEKCREVKRLRENLVLVDQLRVSRLRPLYDAQSRLDRAKAEHEAATSHFNTMMNEAKHVDLADIDERKESINRSIVRLQEDIEHLLKKTIDPTDVEG
jgi:DNA repair exonuclease SbcCD ATPase subunit